jgi:hypothetical protein
MVGVSGCHRLAIFNKVAQFLSSLTGPLAARYHCHALYRGVLREPVLEGDRGGHSHEPE